MLRFVFFILSIFCLCFLSLSQSLTDLKKKKETNLNNINLTRSLLESTKTQKKEKIRDLIILNEQISSRNSLVTNIENEVRILNYRIDTINKSINGHENNLNVLKDEYEQIIINSYRHRNDNDLWVFIFSAESFNQAYKRIRYFQQYARYRTIQKTSILNTKESLKNERTVLDSIIITKSKLLNSLSNEKSTLQLEVKEKQSLLGRLKRDEIRLKRELEKQNKIARDLENTIKDVIAKNRVSNVDDKGIYKLSPEQKLISSEFNKNKGILPWPTTRGIITKYHGKQKHILFKTVETYNPGIDIATPADSYARSIFTGEVKSILNIPGSHKVVIVEHGEYLSVYSNLSIVNVNVGDKVTTKDSIGKIYTGSNSSSGLLHFEIWHNNSNLNPVEWIKRN